MKFAKFVKLDKIAKSSAAAAGELASESSSAVALLQRLAITLHRENARAALRRFGHGLQSPPPAHELGTAFFIIFPDSDFSKKVAHVHSESFAPVFNWG